MLLNTARSSSSYIACPWCWLCGDKEILGHMIFLGYSKPHECKFGACAFEKIKKGITVQSEERLIDLDTQIVRRLIVDKEIKLVDKVNFKFLSIIK